MLPEYPGVLITGKDSHILTGGGGRILGTYSPDLYGNPLLKDNLRVENRCRIATKQVARTRSAERSRRSYGSESDHGPVGPFGA